MRLSPFFVILDYSTFYRKDAEKTGEEKPIPPTGSMVLGVTGLMSLHSNFASLRLCDR